MDISHRLQAIAKKFALPSHVVEAIADVDPWTQHVDWLARNYRAGAITFQEDKDALKHALSLFSKLKKSPNFKSSRDIGTYTPASLIDTIINTSSAEYLGIKRQNQEELKQALLAEVIYDREGIRIFKNEGIGRAQVNSLYYLCRLFGTARWCTGMSRRMARTYLEKGPCYTAHYQGRSYVGITLKPFEMVDSNNLPMHFNRLMRDPIAYKVLEAIDPEVARTFTLLSDPANAPQGLALLEKNLPSTWVSYAELVVGGRWAQAETQLLATAKIAHIIKYIRKVIRGRWPEAEARIMGEATAYDRKWYMREFIHE